jgi:hypothetical protein
MRDGNYWPLWRYCFNGLLQEFSIHLVDFEQKKDW